MLDRLIPKQADNTLPGHSAALWILGVILFMRITISLGSIFNGRGAAVDADGIPIDSYGPAGAQTVVALFAVLGIARLTFGIFGVVVLLRYRALVPLTFALLLLEQLSRQVALGILPIQRTEAPGPWINAGLLIGTIAGLALSLLGRVRPTDPGSGRAAPASG